MVSGGHIYKESICSIFDLNILGKTKKKSGKILGNRGKFREKSGTFTG